RPARRTPTGFGFSTVNARRNVAVPAPTPGGSIRTKPDPLGASRKVGGESTCAPGAHAPTTKSKTSDAAAEIRRASLDTGEPPSRPGRGAANVTAAYAAVSL